MERQNKTRKIPEIFWSGKHLKLDALKDSARAGEISNDYLSKPNIPDFPQPEFHVSHLKHDTDAVGLRGIKEDGGFHDQGRHQDEDYLQWWGLAVKPEDLASAERRLLEKTYPDRTQTQAQAQQQQQGILGNFASSPAFLKTSIYGSYRFTFPVEEVLKAYSQQFCSGAPPVMRVYETVLFKQKVMYVVLVHSPDVQKYGNYPLLSEDDPEAVCCYKDGQFIWKSQAMCETHSYRLVQRPEINQMEAVKLIKKETEFYVWDCVAIALHMKRGQVLTFDRDRLRQTLTFSKGGAFSLSQNGFQYFDQATADVKELWPAYPAPLEEERALPKAP